MNRRDFVKASLGSAAVAAASQAAPAFAAQSGAHAAHSSIVEADITQLQLAMQSGKQSAQSLTKLYLNRIAAFDKAGPRLNAII